MEKSKKKVKVMYPELPMDCWLHIISFLGDNIDLLCLAYVVKGLYDHIGKICPSKTERIPYRLKKYPKKAKVHVTKLNIYQKTGDIAKYLNRIKTFDWHDSAPDRKLKSLDDYFEYLIYRFPNLLHLTFSMRRIEKRLGRWNLTSFRIPRVLNQLKTLDFRISECDIVISEVLPRVETLLITRIDRKFLGEERRDENFEPMSRGKLHVTWSCLPKLIDLSVVSFDIQNAFSDEIKSRLRYFHIDNTITTESVLEGFEGLEDLFLGSESACHFDNIRQLSSLSSLTIDFGGDVIKELDLVHLDNFTDSEPEYILKHHITSLTNLRSLRITNDRIISLVAPGNVNRLSISDLPRLESFFSKNVDTDIEISKAPKLKHLTCIMCHVVDDDEQFSIEIADAETMKNLEKLLVKSVLVGEKFISTIPLLRKLESITLVGRIQWIDDYNPDVVLCKCPKLRSVTISPPFNLRRIFHCPNLQVLLFQNIGEGPDFFESTRQISVLSAKLGNNFADFLNTFSIDSDYRRGRLFGRLTGGLPTITNLRLENSGHVRVKFDLILRHIPSVRNLTLSGFSKVYIDETGCIRPKLRSIISNLGSLCVQNLPDLKRVVWGNLPSHNAIMAFTWDSVCIKNCSSLREIRLEHFSNKKRGYSRIELRSLPMCNVLHLGSLFSGASEFIIQKTPIRVLSITLSPIIRRNDVNNRRVIHEFNISNSNFPHLEKLKINDTCLLKNYECMRINSISMIRHLRKIVIKGTRAFEIESFVDAVFGLKMDECFIYGGESAMDELSKISLTEYFNFMGRKGLWPKKKKE